MLKVNISKYFQVVEYTCAKQMLYRAGMGQRREDGDTLLVYRRPGDMGFYVRKDSEQKPMARLAVDEGSYTDAMHLLDAVGTIQDTVSSNSLPWYEYVDATDLMSVLVSGLVPDALIRPSQAIGRGRRQQEAMEQYVVQLLAWTDRNPQNPLSFT